MGNSNSTVTELSKIGLATAVTCILSPIAIMLPFSPVPISLGLFAIMLSSLLLGARIGCFTCLIYLLLGAVGLPVFSGFSGGIGILLGPGGGYLIGYLFIPVCLFPFGDIYKKSFLYILPGLFIGLFICYLAGSFWLSHEMNLSCQEAFLIGVLPYLPMDIIKIFLAYTLSKKLRYRLTKANLI